MGVKRPIDDLYTAHFIFSKSIEPQLAGLPGYLQEQKTALDSIFEELSIAHKSRVCVAVEKASAGVQGKNWTKRAARTLARTKLYLRATAKEHVREYFPGRAGAASRQIDRLFEVGRVLTVSEHFAHAHLGAFLAELEALRAEGDAIFGAQRVSLADQKTEVAKLKGLVSRWEIQYQRMRFLLRAHFLGTSTSYKKFFDAPRSARAVEIEVDAGELSPPSTVTAVSA